MNYDKYNNTLPYPAKRDFTTTFFYKAGKMILKTNGDVAPQALEIISGTVSDKVVDEIGYQSAKKAYAAESTQLTAMFIADLFDEYGVPDDPFTRQLYSIAYEKGHHAGYSEVASHFSDLIQLHELAKEVYGK